MVELAPKVLDGTRCKADSLDMCINGICQVRNYLFSSVLCQSNISELGVYKISGNYHLDLARFQREASLISVCLLI